MPMECFHIIRPDYYSKLATWSVRLNADAARVQTYRLFFLRSIAQFFYTNLHELFCHFISWANWINSGKFMDNCWISIQVLADMKKVYNDLIIINLYDGKSPVLWYHDTFWQYSAQLYQSNGFSWTRRSFNAMIFIES